VFYAKQDLLKSVPGVGDVVARTLLVELPELAPSPHSPASRRSTTTAGRFRGKRHIQGGRIQVSAPLYMARTWPTGRHPPQSTAARFYQRLRDAGKTRSPRPRRRHA
jgi:transposase